MSTAQQSSRFAVRYSYQFRGQLHTADTRLHPSIKTLNEKDLSDLERFITQRVTQLSANDGLGLLEGEPNVFIFDIRTIKE